MVKLSQKAVEAIERIVNSGGDAEVRFRNGQCVVLDVRKKTEYGTSRIGAKEGR